MNESDVPDHDYHNESVIGHHVRANRESYDSPLFAQEGSSSLLSPPPYKIRIVEGDVDWDSTREVCVTIEELREMALEFTHLSE